MMWRCAAALTTVPLPSWCWEGLVLSYLVFSVATMEFYIENRNPELPCSILFGADW
jgi:hypothetical protein